MLVRFIGDVHGKFGAYKKLIADCTTSIQVGDMGVGFKYRHRDGEMRYSANPPYDAMTAPETNHRFIRGNHDNPEVCRRHTQWIEDGTTEVIGQSKVMFVGGAWSIDWAGRTPGWDWWEDEEIFIGRLNQLVDWYIEFKPDVMISHDCPTIVANFSHLSAHQPRITTRTDQALQAMLDNHKPKLHVYGHWHQSRVLELEGTRFECLPELGYVDVEL